MRQGPVNTGFVVKSPIVMFGAQGVKIDNQWLIAIVEIKTLSASLVVYYFQLLHQNPLLFLYTFDK